MHVVQLSPDPGEVGFYTRFAAIGTYGDSSQRNLTFDATWTNGNESVAELFWDGLAKGLSSGSTSLTAIYGITDTASFTVNTATKDIIIIEEANWEYTKRPNRGTLSVTATNTWDSPEDDVTLEVEGYGTMTYDAATGKHSLSATRVTCPYTVWVSSNVGGRSYAFTTVERPSAAPTRADMPIASGGPKDEGTILLQNMPNPFNPDTWIPFKLSKAEHVVIRIHDMTGRLVRTLQLGEKAPGAYINKEKAAHWNGKNEAGEQVASGIYFYTIQAGAYTATRKMVIAK
jgi:hypothetical protein